jgi:hypothetical protein
MRDDISAIWVASVARTGSMWVFNVLRELVRLDGGSPRPEIVPSTDDEMEAIGKAGIAAGDGPYVLKVHTRIPADLPHSLFVVTHRDLHDSIVSFMRFAKADFDQGMRFLASSLRLEEHYATFPPQRALHLQYRDIIGAPETVIAILATTLGISADRAAIASIAQHFSKDSVRARLAERETALRDKLDNDEPIDQREFVQHHDGTLRAFDAETGFQSGHVSAYREGDWRRILTPAQQQAIDDLITYAESKRRERG